MVAIGLVIGAICGALDVPVLVVVALAVLMNDVAVAVGHRTALRRDSAYAGIGR